MQNKSLIIFAFASLLMLAGCKSEQNAGSMDMPAVPVIAAAPVVKDITVYLESLGTLQPSVFMEIRPRTDGTLVEVLVKEGEWVQKDTPLFKVDPKPYEIKVQEAKAQFAIDQAAYRAIEKKLERFRDLAQKDLVAQTEWDDLEAQAEKAKGMVILDDARLDSAKLDLEYCTIKSPIEGRVGKFDAHPGILVSSSQTTPLATISKMDPLIVEFEVTEKEFASIPKQNLKIELKSHCSKEPCKEAEVTFLDNHFDSATGLLLVRGKVENGEHSLRPGQSVRVRIPISTVANAKVIPQKAIRYNQEGPYIYVIQPDMTVAVRQLILGSELGDDQIVKEGIDPSEQIILDGHLRLSPGIKVEIKS